VNAPARFAVEDSRRIGLAAGGAGRSRARRIEVWTSPSDAPACGTIAISFGLISYSAPVVPQVFKHVLQLFVANL
jgi:hypothetical protein